LWWREQPIEERARLTKAFNLDGRVNVRAPLGMPVLNEILRTLYSAPSMITVLPIQDLFGWCARVNVPGTVSESNWTYRLPIPFERMATSHAIQARVRDLKQIALASKRF
jgi:4-alpha-glucanotransferase